VSRTHRNESFGGPGNGVDGEAGQPFENSEAHGNILIISEDGSSVQPDDNKFGGILKFVFDEPTSVDSVGLLDIERKFQIICILVSFLHRAHMHLRYLLFVEIRNWIHRGTHYGYGLSVRSSGHWR